MGSYISFKEVYLHQCPIGQHISWVKAIWHIVIPPSKPLLIWRSLNNKLPTDDKLSTKGCYLSSMCNLCNSNIETSKHIFFKCEFSIHIWQWLNNILKCSATLIPLLRLLTFALEAGLPYAS